VGLQLVDRLKQPGGSSDQKLGATTEHVDASDGVAEESQIKSEAKTVVEMVSSLPVFVLMNQGTYYSGTMLMYATGTNAHATEVYRWLRDHRLKGRTEREARKVGLDNPEPAGPANMAASGPDGLAVVQTPAGGCQCRLTVAC
jgi:hypothetical protein